MTRGLHQATRVQRGDPADFPKAEIKRGYDAGDAPAAKVALGVAAFVAVMFMGLVAAGLVANLGSAAHVPSAAAATRGAQKPPPPRLLADPVQERRQIEGAARQRLHSGPAPIDQAMARVAQRGWGEDAPAPSAADIARDHAQDAR